MVVGLALPLDFLLLAPLVVLALALDLLLLAPLVVLALALDFLLLAPLVGLALALDLLLLAPLVVPALPLDFLLPSLVVIPALALNLLLLAPVIILALTLDVLLTALVIGLHLPGAFLLLPPLLQVFGPPVQALVAAPVLPWRPDPSLGFAFPVGRRLSVRLEGPRVAFLSFLPRRPDLSLGPAAPVRSFPVEHLRRPRPAPLPVGRRLSVRLEGPRVAFPPVFPRRPDPGCRLLSDIDRRPLIAADLPFPLARLDLALRQGHLPEWPVHLARLHHSRGESRPAHLGCRRSREGGAGHPFQVALDPLAVEPFPLADNALVVVDALQGRGMRLAIDPPGVGGEAAPVRVEILDDGVVDDRGRPVVVDDHRAVDRALDVGRVARRTVEAVAGHHDGRIEIAVAAQVDPVVAVTDDHGGAPAPVPVAVVGLVRGERHPADGAVIVQPAHPARVPAEAEEQGRGPAHRAHHRRRPVPGTGRVDVHPRAVVVGHVAERLVRHPAVVAVVDDPAAGGVGPPVRLDPGGPPQVVVGALVADPLPAAVLLQRGRFLADGLGQVVGGAAGGVQAPGPVVVTQYVPIVPAGVHRAVARFGAGAVGDDRGKPFPHLVLATGGLVEEIHGAADGDHLGAVVAHVDVDHGVTQGHHRAERGGHLDDPVRVFVVHPGQAQAHVQGGGVRVEGDELQLGVLAGTDPGAVGHDELGAGVVLHVEAVLQAEGRVTHGAHPVAVLLDVAEQVAFDVGDAADQDRVLRVGGARACPGRHKADDEQDKAAQGQ